MKTIILPRPRASTRRTITVSTTPRIQLLSKKSFETDKHQENIKQVLLNSNATPINYKPRDVRYWCCFCAQHFDEPAQLKDHTISQHDRSVRSTFMKGCSILSYIVRLDITGLKCILCDMETREFNDLIKHLQLEHKKNFHSDIDNHIVPFRFDCTNLYCVYCKENFNHFKGLAEHMNSHYRNYVCEVCDAGFVNKRTLRTHGYRHKTGVFKCSLCSKVFDTKVKRSNHEWGIHLNPKRHKCVYCDERFSDYTKKKEHEVKMHGAKQIILQCKACDKNFESQRALNFHTQYHHLLQRKKRDC